MKSKKIICILAIVLTAGCATTENYENILKSWVGSHSDSLVASWGPPQSSFKMSNGGMILEYTDQRNVQIGGYTYTRPQTTYHSGSLYGSTNTSYNGTSTTYVQTKTPTYNIPLACVTRFTTNSYGRIISWSWQGNNCKATAP